MYTLKFLLPGVLLFFCGLFIACNRDDITTFGPGVAVTFAGRIVDEDGQAVANVQVSAGGEQALTDANGVFRLKSIREDSRNAILHVTKTGYFEFSRAYVVQDDAIHTVQIQLLKKVQVGTVETAGGTINVPGGATLLFPAGAVSNADGSAFTGTVQVFARYLDPTDAELGYNMPGDLRGIKADKAEGVLSTFGMIGVELQSSSGQLLQVAAGRSVEIRMPIPSALAAVAPATIPLWHYNTENARWEEEGSAQKIGNEYVGTVTHFSFWNCDSFSETVYMEGKVFLRDLQTPLANAQIRLTVLSNGFQGIAFTNGNGWYGGAIPKDYEMKLEVLVPDLCGGQVLYTQNVGPFLNDVVLPDIVVNPSGISTVSISGRLTDCNGAPVPEGYVLVTAGTQVFALYPGPNGVFTSTLINCLNTTSGIVKGYDIENLRESAPVPFSLGSATVNLGDIFVCQNLDEYIQYVLDGQTRLKTNPSVTVNEDPSLPGSYITVINSLDSLDTGISFWFVNNNQPGTFQIEGGFYVSPYEFNAANNNLQTTITTAPANVGDLLIGSFTGDFKDSGGNQHTISGNYRIYRE